MVSLYSNIKFENKKNYKEIAYRGISVFKNEKDNVMYFTARVGEGVASAIREVIRYLKLNNINGEYSLYFNDDILKINANSDLNTLFDEYLGDSKDELLND